nr:tigger transposable element-derived protein 6-like [Parasteatoda tepidariorum]
MKSAEAESKVRLTLLLAANEEGLEKLPPLMIEHSEKPRCFAKLKSFPFKYRAKRKAWMKSEIFGDWLKSLDKSMRMKKRKIIVFIDNCTAHNNLPNLKNVTVKYFPANTTSKLQPMNQGIIRSFKVNYRKQLVRTFVDAINEKSSLPKINALDTIKMTDYAWRNVSLKTVRNGFKKAGFRNNCEEDEEEVEGINKEKETDDNENAVPDLQEWNTIKSRINDDINFEDFLQVDNCLAMCGTLTDAEIIDNVRGISDEEEEAEDHIDELKVSAKEAEKAVEILQTFFLIPEKHRL